MGDWPLLHLDNARRPGNSQAKKQRKKGEISQKTVTILSKCEVDMPLKMVWGISEREIAMCKQVIWNFGGILPKIVEMFEEMTKKWSSEIVTNSRAVFETHAVGPFYRT